MLIASPKISNRKLVKEWRILTKKFLSVGQRIHKTIRLDSINSYYLILLFVVAVVLVKLLVVIVSVFCTTKEKWYELHKCHCQRYERLLKKKGGNSFFYTCSILFMQILHFSNWNCTYNWWRDGKIKTLHFVLFCFLVNFCNVLVKFSSLNFKLLSIHCFTFRFL